jgi:hypothetical protein
MIYLLAVPFWALVAYLLDRMLKVEPYKQDHLDWYIYGWMTDGNHNR